MGSRIGEEPNLPDRKRKTQRRIDQYGSVGREPYLRRRGGRPGRVEEDRLRLGDGRPGRWRLTTGRTAGEGSGEREDGGGRRLRSYGQRRDARVSYLLVFVYSQCSI
jgi:hypothetical protein